MLAPGLALVIEFVLRRPLVALAPVVAATLWWNHLLMVQPMDRHPTRGRVLHAADTDDRQRVLEK